jgi:type I restriction enzyme S subunit
MSTQAQTTNATVGNELPPGWRMSTIGELLKVRNGFAFKSTEYKEEGALLIRQSNLDGSRVTIEKARYLPKVYLDEYRDFLIKKGDILIGMSGSIGKLCVYDRDEPALQNQRTGLLVFKDPEQKPWVWHYLPLLEKDLVKVGKGVAVQNISASQIESFPIPVAPLDQQKQIVAEIEKQFSRLDQAVANLKRVKANLKRYKAAVLKAAVEGRLVETEAELARKEGRNYETGEQLLQRILETRRSQWKGKGKYKEPAAPDTTDLPELPEGWVWATYAQIGEVTTGFTPPTADTENFGGDIPFFKPTDLDAGDNVVEAREYLSEKGAAKGRLLSAGSVLVTCIGATIGKTGLARVDCATNQQINAVTPQGRLVDSAFIYAWTVSPYGYKQILDNSSATTLPILNKSKFEALPVPLPPLAEQCRIIVEVDRRLSLVREVEAQVDANRTRAARMRHSLLSDFFSGKRSTRAR